MKKTLVGAGAVSLLMLGAVAGSALLPSVSAQKETAAKSAVSVKSVELSSPGIDSRAALDQVAEIRLSRVPCATANDAGCVPGVLVTVNACATAAALKDCRQITYFATEEEVAGLYASAIKQWNTAAGY